MMKMTTTRKNKGCHQWLLSIAFLLCWLGYMSYSQKWPLFQNNWFMTVTMIFASFIAGATAEGGGAVAFPIMTLLFNIPPVIARNFSLAIQSCGMTAAAFFLIHRQTPIEKTYLFLCSFGGIGGMIIGTYWLAPYLAPAYTKMFFVSLWLSFGAVLFYLNTQKKRQVKAKLPKLDASEKIFLTSIGILGGVVSSLAGSGLDILSFSVVTTRYHLSEKIATPTSVCLMAGNSLVGFLLHSRILKDFGGQEFNYWLVSIPVVIFFAPLGANYISNKTRGFIANLLYMVLLIQFICACLIVPAWKTTSLLLFTITILCFGLLLFSYLSLPRKPHFTI